jgi:hypothetical protein
MTLSSGESESIDSVVDQAGLPPQASAKLGRIATVLFTYLKQGAGPIEVMTPEIVAKAYEMSGPFVIGNLDAWPDDGSDPTTNACASLCGHRMRILAEGRGTDAATVDDFVTAWVDTRDSQVASLDRHRRMTTGAGTGAESNPVGLGCGA